MLTELIACPRRWSIVDGIPIPIAPMSSSGGPRRRFDLRENASSLLVSVARRPLLDDTFIVEDAGREQLRTPEVEAITRGAATAAATITRRVPPKDKPYRIYSGGRAKGPDPARAAEVRRKAEKREGERTEPRY